MMMAALLLLLSLQGGAPPSPRPAPAPPAWEPIEGGPGTGCALGTPYRFFHRPGRDPGRLLIYFQGGGACWSWVSCSGMFDTTVEDSEIADYGGIFDVNRPDNPLAGHEVLFIPYCTGDVHVGSKTATYGDREGARPVHHHGARNVEAALAWIRHRHPHPRQVVVAGASAGAYGAVFHAPRIARLYPGADLIVVPDSGVPLLHDHETILAAWGIEAALGPAGGAGEARSWSLTTAYEKAVSAAGVRAMAVLTSDRDAVQGAFYLISGSPSWREETYALLDALERSHPSFHSFVVGGADHGLMRTDQFYDYRAGSVRLADWLGRLLAGEPVESVRCDGCRLP